MPTMTPARAGEFYRQMYRIRAFEERAYELYMQALLIGAIHSYQGEEAIAVGVCGNLELEDYVLSTHRGHGHCLAKGLDSGSMLAEMLGKGTGVCHGKAGSMHLCDAGKGLLSCNGIVAAGLPLAVGVGLSIKQRGTEQVCVCFFGDGGINQGTFHESLNMASAWKLPILFVCENNQYALSTLSQSVTAVERLADRAAAYAMPGRTIDGMDVEAVDVTAGELIASVRRGDGPALLECVAYRFRGHSRGDPDFGPYRTREELNEWKDKDPLKVLAGNGVLSTEALREIEAEVDREMDDAVDYAKESPAPEPAAAFEDVRGA
ncbi:MAG: thiamine pyrophosphate-dependent enzyme [Acidobacteriota bacterium]